MNTPQTHAHRHTDGFNHGRLSRCLASTLPSLVSEYSQSSSVLVARYRPPVDESGRRERPTSDVQHLEKPEHPSAARCLHRPPSTVYRPLSHRPPFLYAQGGLSTLLALLLLAVGLLAAFAQRAEATWATGGTVTNYFDAGGMGWTAHIFKNVGPNTFTVTSDGNVEYLVVGGGGSGGANGSAGNGGGGGAGGLISGTLTVSASTLSITVGDGGTVAASGSPGNNGGNSTFSSITATGGGGGGTYNTSTTTAPGSGGSGGGAAQYDTKSGNTGGSGTSGQGNKGGDRNTTAATSYGGAGGGGAGAAGSNNSGNNGQNGGNGGAGLESLITGSSVFYAGGGGGSTHNTGTTAATGGTGGGGNGQYGGTAATSGAANTGGGGGGGGEGKAAGSGGSGIVIVRYPSPDQKITPCQMQITFGGYTNRSEVLTNFPVLVVLSNNINNSGFHYGYFVTANGYDLRFATDAKPTTNSLNYEIESWNPGGTSYVWVQVPTIPTNGQGAIWAYWGNTSASTQLPCTTNGAVWTNGFQAVWHMQAVNATDSSINRNNGTASGGVTLSTGRVGPALTLDGSSGSLDVASTDLFKGSDNVTVSFWAMPTGAANQQDNTDILDYSHDDGTFGNFAVQRQGTGAGLIWSWAIRTGGNSWGPNDVSKTFTLVQDQWKHGTLTKSGTSYSFYLDGVVLSGSPFPAGSATIDKKTAKLRIGRHAADATRHFRGQLDEIRVSNTARSTNWVWAEYQNQANNTTFNNYGAMEKQPSPKGTVIMMR
ncbi:MAG: DUF2341 domain-containing protein [Kiritimatiellia bacterium]